MGLLRTIFNLVFWLGVGITGVLNAQGWLVVGEWVNRSIEVIPMIGLLTKIPWVGGWFLMLTGAVGSIVGFALWAGIQWVQVAPMFVSNQKISDLRVWAYVLEIIVCFARFSPYQGGYPAFWSDLLAGMLDIDLFIFENIMMAVLSIVLFELIIATGIEVRNALGVGSRGNAA